ncbi:MAG: hypothetical protein KAV87_41135 [Desulfobacteraceae bacterium]|nr:hypothetical protein [Desulfobacteraceae bacterium]
MTTKAELEEALGLTNERLTLASQRAVVAENAARQLKIDVGIQGKHITCLNANRDHVRHAVEAFAAAECPDLNFDVNTSIGLPTAVMEAMGVRPAAAPTRHPGQGRDIMADMLEHLHKLVR